MEPAPRSASLPSGWPALDALLGGGWPAGQLIELRGQGCATLGLGAVREAQSAGQPAAWVDGTATFCPATAAIDLDRLTLVRPPAAEPVAQAARAAPRRSRRRPAALALLAADLLLRSRAFGLLVLDLPVAAGRTPPLAAWFRLARQASRAQSVLLLLAADRAVAGSAAGLTLRASWRHPPAAAWESCPAPALEVAVLRRRGAHGDHAVLLPCASAS